MSQQKQESTQFSPETIQQLKVLQARITNADLAEMDMRKEINASIQILLTQVDALQKENVELKGKLQDKA
jgi:hypothetical protein